MLFVAASCELAPGTLLPAVLSQQGRFDARFAHSMNARICAKPYSTFRPLNM